MLDEQDKAERMKGTGARPEDMIEVREGALTTTCMVMHKSMKFEHRPGPTTPVRALGEYPMTCFSMTTMAIPRGFLYPLNGLNVRRQDLLDSCASRKKLSINNIACPK